MYSIPITELEKNDPEIWGKFCGNCSFLNPTENKQDVLKRDLGIPKGKHWCNKFKTEVYHQFAHPHIYKTEDCQRG